MKPSSLVVDLQSSSQLSADELLERFRRYRGNSLFASSHYYALLPLSLSVRLLSSFLLTFLSFSHLRRLAESLADSLQAGESHAGYLHVSVARETKNYYLYALVGGAEDFAVHKLS